MNLKLEIRGFTELRKHFADAPRKMQDIKRDWQADVANAQAELIRRRAPVKTGALRESIQPYARNLIIGVEFTPLLKYTNWVNDGTGIYGARKQPIPIAARRAKALHFFWRGKEFFRTSVLVKGIKPRRFIEKGIADMDKKIPAMLRDLERRLAAVLEGK